MDNLTKRISSLMTQNRRISGNYQYTLPSPQSYPYQWFWDSCFHAIILSHFSVEDAKKELRSLIAKQFDNGMIPHMIYWQKATDTDFPVIQWGRNDTSSITQPPMLAYAVWEIYQKDHDKKFLEEMYVPLNRLHHYFLSERDAHGNHLISIINPDESGEDNSPRFDLALGLKAEHDIQTNYKARLKLIADNKECNFDAPYCMRNFFWVKDVPFNVILIRNLQIMAQIANEIGNEIDLNYTLSQAESITQSMHALMKEDGLYWSIYLRPGEEQYQKIKVTTWHIFAPLFAKILTQNEASDLVKNYLQNQNYFNLPFILPTVAKLDPSFDPNGFWRGPVWMSINWFVYKGLMNYGLEKEAQLLFNSSLTLLQKSGFREQFNPLTGAGQGAKDFTWGGLIIDMKQ